MVSVVLLHKVIILNYNWLGVKLLFDGLQVHASFSMVAILAFLNN